MKTPQLRGVGEKNSNAGADYYTRLTPAEKLLPRLQRVKPTGNDRWIASCPTAAHKHGDRSQGLSIKECMDGAVLIRCHAGCSAADVVAAVGLQLRELFPPSPPPVRAHRAKQKRLRLGIDAAELELLICLFFMHDFVLGREISPSDFSRAKLACNRIQQLGAA